MRNTILAITPMILASILAANLVTPAQARADQLGPAYRPWVTALKQAARSGQLLFESVDLTGGNVGGPTLDPMIIQALQKVAFDQAQIWADTILEGDYLASNKISLDGVEIVRIGAQVVGYRVTYSANAVETTACSGSEDYKQALANGCTRGKIWESSFVSLDIASWTRDTSRYATFEPAQ